MSMPNQTEGIYLLGGGSAAGSSGTVDAMGFKAYNLARIAGLNLPIPPAFVLGTGFCRDYFSRAGRMREDLPDVLLASLRRLELLSGLEFGSERRPLMVSVRSGAPVSMPGMMETILNIGLCDATLRGMLRMTGNARLVWDCYRRLIQSFAEVVCGCPAGPFEDALTETLRSSGEEDAGELDFMALRELTRRYLEIFHSLAGREFPQNPIDQLADAVEAVFKSWNSPKAVEYRRLNDLDDSAGTAVTVQRMVFGNAGGDSGSGVAFTRDPATGENRLYLDFAFNAQGEDVVSGRHIVHDSEMLGILLPDSYNEILKVRQSLETEFLDVQEFEFTIQEGRTFILQTRTAKRSPSAALRIAVEQVDEGLIDPEEALRRLRDCDIESIFQTRLIAGTDAERLAPAVPAGLGVAVGRVALDSAKAVEFASAGEAVIFIRRDTSTSDISGIAAAAGILTGQGGRTSHAAVIARQMNKVCLVGCSALTIDSENRRCRVGERWFSEGDLLGLDGNAGFVVHSPGRDLKVVSEKPEKYLARVREWLGHS